MSTVKRFPPSAQTQEIFQILKADGVIVIEAAAKTAALDSAIDKIGSLTEGQNFGLLCKSRKFATELLMNDLFIGLTKHLLTATYITNTNGAMRAITGSNMWKDFRDPTGKDETLIELQQGDAILCLGSILYGQMPNFSNETNVLLNVFASPGWCRQEENQYLAVPHEYVEILLKDVQRFLRYYFSLPEGGAVEHMEPLDFLAAKGNWIKYIAVDLV
ncbi:hypothetical protein ACHAPU_011414 [Fusarium lateritium]